MKKALYIILAIASVLAVSCKKDVYTPGEPDSKDCINVTFPAQENQGDLELDPENGTSFDITVAREKTDAAVTVPLRAVCLGNADVVSVEDAVFGAGEAETSVKVTFNSPESGKTYRCDVYVADDKYILKYSTEATSLGFNVVFIKWNTVAKGTYVSSLIGPIEGVELQQCGSDPTALRFVAPFAGLGSSNNLLFSISSDEQEDEDGKFVNISVDEQGTGLTGSGYPISICDYYSYTGVDGAPGAMYEDFSLYFYAIYYCEAGVFADGYDEFVPDDAQ